MTEHQPSKEAGRSWDATRMWGRGIRLSEQIEEDHTMSESVTKLTPTKPDSEIAAELRAELSPLLAQASGIIDAARRTHGLVVNFSIGPDNFGRIRCQEIVVTRPL